MKGPSWTFFITGGFLVTALFGLWGNGAAVFPSFLVATVLGVVCAVVGVVRLLRLRRPLEVSSVSLALLPLVAVLVIFFRFDVQAVNGFKSRVVFEGTCEHTVTYVHLVLRENGSCEFEPGSFLDRNWQEGIWTRAGDTLHLQMSGSRNQAAMSMELQTTPQGLVEISSDTLSHAHGFAGKTDDIVAFKADRLQHRLRPPSEIVIEDKVVLAIAGAILKFRVGYGRG